MILTTGEKMVWAAAFAEELRVQIADSQDAQEYGTEDNYDLCVRCGVESACDAVTSLRRQNASGWKGKPEDEVAMVRAMLGDEG